MVLNEQPDIAIARQRRCTQAAIRKPRAAEIFGQYAERPVALDQRADDADVVADEARLLLQAAGLEELRLGNRAEIVGIDAGKRLGFAAGGGLDQIQPEITELGDREVALVRLLQAHREVGLPAREFYVLAGGEELQRKSR